MSAVIHKAQQQHRKTLIWEVCILVSLSLFCLLWQFNVSLSFFAGAMSSFLPYVLFVYWIFFRKSAKNRQQMTAFYRGEGLKWLATILLVVLSFKMIPDLHLVGFFVGYFLALCLNIALPIFINK